jgi:hypothetical protein
MPWTTLVCLALTQDATNPPTATADAPTAAAQVVPPRPRVEASAPLDAPGLHNVVAFAPDVLSGSVPEGDAGFDSLKGWGVLTIISVDGAVPDVERAKSRGMRYVHLPIGYHGFDEARKLELARAVHDLPRPVYIHCHHGKHRSAGAAGTIAVTLGWMTPEQAVARMKVAGTAPSYPGLYRCTQDAVKVADAAISGARADFPEVARPAGLVKGMVEIDLTWDNLKAAQRAGWTVPADHPDLVPAAEAGRLAETFRPLCDDALVKGKPTEFQALMARSAEQARSLEELLATLPVGARPSPEVAERLNAVALQIAATCKACHSAYRD